MTQDDSDEAPSESVLSSIGSDGLVVRYDGEWAEEKLFYIERYIDIFTTGMKNKWSRVYIDLFSGPGRSVIRGTGREIDGSPLRASNARFGFRELYFNDADPRAINALKARIEARNTPIGRIHYATLDCNAAALEAGDVLFGSQPDTLGLAVIDPTAFQISLAAIQSMTSGRRIDLIITFMSSYVRRFLARPGYESVMDAFFGSSDWRRFIDTRSRGERVTYGDLLNFYKERLESIGYPYVNTKVSVANTRSQPIYHLVFASKSELGNEFFEKISKRRFTGQQRMEF